MVIFGEFLVKHLPEISSSNSKLSHFSKYASKYLIHIYVTFDNLISIFEWSTSKLSRSLFCTVPKTANRYNYLSGHIYPYASPICCTRANGSIIVLRHHYISRCRITRYWCKYIYIYIFDDLLRFFKRCTRRMLQKIWLKYSQRQSVKL